MPSSSSDCRVALVTGGSRGIGREIAIELARSGHHVVVNYRREATAAEAVVREIELLGGEAIACAADVGELSDHPRLVEAAMSRWGRIDVLVNNAGITSPGRKDLLEATPEGWDLVLNTNLRGPFFLSQLVARQMIELRQANTLEVGYLINISSISSYAVSVNRADYCVAKAGLQMMTHLFATRLADENVLVYEICPGVIASDMTAPVKEKYDALIEQGLTPLRRWGTPHDVARAVTMICDGALPFSTGERLNVDGGFHLRRL
ncbi:MAG: 3-ketoacyl-ACP reductase [Planctomycetales bacterium]|nr:3-ketoacyl-ACP reductase [Planctomycetales bacterium]